MIGIAKPKSRWAALPSHKWHPASVADRNGKGRHRKWLSCPPHLRRKLRAFTLKAVIFMALFHLGINKFFDDKNGLCGRRIPFDIGSVEYAVPPKLEPNGKVLLLDGSEGQFGDFGAQLSSFFHAYDLAQSEKAELALTYGSWVFRTLSPLWLGLPESIQTSPEWRNKVEKILGVAIVKDEASLPRGSEVISKPSKDLFFIRANDSPDNVKNHREAILRRLFLHISQGEDGADNACAAVEKLVDVSPTGLFKREVTPFSVIQASEPSGGALLDKWARQRHADFVPVIDMTPEYVKSILRREGMLNHKKYVVSLGQSGKIENRVRIDNELSNELNWVPFDPTHPGSNIMLAVLADVYLGNPLDHTSMWIARMRYALGMKGTYVLTKKEGNEWVSYVDDDHLYLYNNPGVGPWAG